MTSPAPSPRATAGLFADLFDDARLFGPPSMSMREAFDAHRVAQQGGYRWMLGRFVVPATRLEELASVASRYGDRLQLAIVVDDPTAAERVAAATDEHGWHVATVETVFRHAAVSATATGLRDFMDATGAGRGFLELAWNDLAGDPIDRVVEAAHDAGVGVTLRCDARDPQSFPAPSVVASVIAACRDASVALKLIAGLQHPFRRPEPGVGVLSHGFVNLVVAAAMAHAHGATATELAAVVSEDAASAFVVDGSAIRWRDTTVDADEIVAARRGLLPAIATGSFPQSVDDLVALGWLAVP